MDPESTAPPGPHKPHGEAIAEYLMACDVTDVRARGS